MVDEVKSAWADLPTYARRGFYAGGLLVALAGGVAVAPSPEQVDPAVFRRLAEQVPRNTAAIDTLRAEQRAVRDEQRVDRAHLEFLSCDRQAEKGRGAKSADECFDDFRRAMRGAP